MAVVLECEIFSTEAFLRAKKPWQQQASLVDIIIGGDIGIVNGKEVLDEVLEEKSVATPFCIRNSIEYRGSHLTASPLQHLTPPDVPARCSQQKVLLLPHESIASPYLKVANGRLERRVSKTR